MNDPFLAELISTVSEFRLQRFEVLVISGGQQIVGSITPPEVYRKTLERSLDLAFPPPDDRSIVMNETTVARGSLKKKLNESVEALGKRHLLLEEVSIGGHKVPCFPVELDSITAWALLRGHVRSPEEVYSL